MSEDLQRAQDLLDAVVQQRNDLSAHLAHAKADLRAAHREIEGLKRLLTEKPQPVDTGEPVELRMVQ